jgi:hypothetical protein
MRSLSIGGRPLPAIDVGGLAVFRCPRQVHSLLAWGSCTSDTSMPRRPYHHPPVCSFKNLIMACLLKIHLGALHFDLDLPWCKRLVDLYAAVVQRPHGLATIGSPMNAAWDPRRAFEGCSSCLYSMAREVLHTSLERRKPLTRRCGTPSAALRIAWALMRATTQPTGAHKSRLHQGA